MPFEPEPSGNEITVRVPRVRVLGPDRDNRRAGLRFCVDGSLVRVPSRPTRVADGDVREMLFDFMPALWTQRRQVLNVSCGGLAFESRSPFACGRKLRLHLWLTGFDKPLELVAETRWCKRLGRDYRVGVRFEAFADRPDANPPAALQVLQQLEAQHT